jgi:hypothetical protein
MAGVKEVHFFDNEDAFRNGQPDYELYHAAFSPSTSHELIGEATPIYMYWYDAPRRMWEYNPNLKLIVLLRNPIERAYSHWNMMRSEGTDSLPFWEAIQIERERCREELPLQHRYYSYIDRGLYLDQLRRLWTFFPRDQVLILKNEALRHEPMQSLHSVCRFLGVDPPSAIDTMDVHSRPYVSAMSQSERDYLRSVFEFEIRGLERELGWNCSSWIADNPASRIEHDQGGGSILKSSLSRCASRNLSFIAAITSGWSAATSRVSPGSRAGL